MKRPEWQLRLEPFAVFWACARDTGAAPKGWVRLPDAQAHAYYTALMEPMTKPDLRKLARACATATHGNCWFATFRVIRDPEFLKVLNADGVILHWGNGECHTPGKRACAYWGCNKASSSEGGPKA